MREGHDPSPAPAPQAVERNQRDPRKAMIWTTLLFCHFATAIVAAILAKNRRRRAPRWFLLTLPLGVLTLFLLLALPDAEQDT